MSTPQENKARGISHHFKRESKLMLWFCIGIPLLLAVLAGVLGPLVLNFASAREIDRCVDSGGRFNQETRVCERTQQKR